MGKSIQKKWFGPATLAGNQIVVNGVKFADGTTATNAYIVKQTGSSAYVVQDSAMAHAPEIVFMVNAASLSALLPGQCYILATPFGGSPLPCAKIAQFRVDIYNVAKTTPVEVGAPIDIAITSYSWSTIPANTYGQADLISGSGAVGAILSITPGAAGFGYLTAPTVTLNGGGVGGAVHTTIANGAVSSYVIDSAGANYANGNITVGAPSRITATCATGFATSGVVTTGSVVVTNGGGYYLTAPAVTVVGGDGTATAHAVVANGVVTSVVVDTGGTTGYVTPVSITAPPAAVQATASATISV